MAVYKGTCGRRNVVVWLAAVVAWGWSVGAVVHSQPSDGPSTAGSVAVTVFLAVVFGVLFFVGTWLMVGYRGRRKRQTR